MSKRMTLTEALNFEFESTIPVNTPFIRLYNLTKGSGAVFDELDWLPDAATAQHLDYLYIGIHSGDKYISPYLTKILDASVADYILMTQMTQLMQTAGYMFLDNWNARYSVMVAQYDPLENYNMTESMTNDQTTHQKGTTLTRTLNTNHAKTGTETDAPTNSVTTDTSVFGYDSNTAAPAQKEVVTNSGQDQVTYNTSDADTGTITDVGTGTDTDTRNYSLSRSGNIGVMATQEMLQKELEVRKYNFYQSVFEDLDKILTIAIY